ncbi:EAL domain-containing protein [Psychrobacillus glaciei]|uniref:EAL domain-containing protein n=1 Tax=Psychrobacillus glaciei TaxID=2283160 RepID=A0A5J6SNX8_9BACI|nr:EAL domain-containing protein [Psychrobacillus glaciei]QFF98464.1 EAL domain-containing protein [Psychrobacillus glaciei]
MFTSPSQNNFIVLDGEYSISLVVLSVFVATIASYTALSMNERAQQNSFFHRNFWLILAAVAMGFGIWSMHFIGMSAFSLPVEMRNDKLLTVVSVIPAMLASFLAFYLADLKSRTFWSYTLAGIAMGIGISSMHYLGMYAMKMDIVYAYDKTLFAGSIVIAVVVSVVAIYIFSTLQKYMTNRLIQIITSVVMGLAVSSMHYTGMAAITFFVPIGFIPDPVHTHMESMNGIAISVTIGMAMLLGSLLISSLVDRYVEFRANYYDVLTKLPNRRLFEQKLKRAAFPENLAIIHIHNLEYINREYDYQFGDEIIQRLAAILKSLTPPSTDLYRIEGNRFALLTRDKVGEKLFQEGLLQIAEALQQPHTVHKQEILIPTLCAVSTASNEKEAATIYSNALAVLNFPSIQFNHEVVYYNPTIHTYTFEREIAESVVHAMNEGELFLVYQPKIGVNTNEVIGVETLIRWNHSTYGLLSPAVFIPILEENDRMIDLTDWIIEQVCQQISVWHSMDISFGQVAINIPGQYVTAPRLLQVLKRTLHNYNLVPQQLELEITETSFVKNIEEAMRAVSTFRQEGFSVALDDFGTGVSSLSYLKQMPISTLKIDKSFVDGIPESSKDSSIIQAIIALGSSLNLSIVFEGVETKEQVEFLASICKEPIIQGYYFSKPLKTDELFNWYQVFKSLIS